MINVLDLQKVYGPLKVLDGVTLECERGKVTAILGESGGGKSTFLKILIGAVEPDAGDIWIDGKNIRTLNEQGLDAVRQQIGMLFQHAALFHSMTVGENVALPILENTTLDDNIVEIIVKMKLEQVGLSDFEEFMPGQLSGGMQKRVGLARAIALDPKIVLYDEPSGGLDPISAAVIDKLIVDLNRVLGITSVVVTHDIRSAMKIAHKVVLLHQGRVLIEGTPDDLATAEDPLVRQFLNGDPDGPIQLRKSREEYERSLLGN
ncbi:MAG: ABC transporter ATP-binding protein [Candidatus Latescibacteria bacterium]|nr:ABC transporter ATP-binding protein [Candidatus Latescibacterota bacterium]